MSGVEYLKIDQDILRGNVYAIMIFVIIEIDLPFCDLQNVWFQQDGSPSPNISRAPQSIRYTFQQQVIGYGGCDEWRSRSPDLSPLDFTVY
ncbi:uncharacterized protein TNCV_3257121 [Trichonephila clavipes]|nr:uncharacterized protein TNCV_3257121 [Trichonephila clavipes]